MNMDKARALASVMRRNRDKGIVLLLCPYCGGEALLSTWSGGKAAQVSCSSSGCYASLGESHGRTATDSAVAYWNTRTEGGR